MQNKKGFSLTELIAVIVIIGIVILVAIPVSNKINENKKYKQYDIYFKTLAKAIDTFLDTEQGFYYSGDNKFYTIDQIKNADTHGSTNCISKLKSTLLEGDSYTAKEYDCKLSYLKFKGTGYISDKGDNKGIAENIIRNYIYITLNEDKDGFVLDSFDITIDDYYTHYYYNWSVGTELLNGLYKIDAGPKRYIPLI